MDPGEVFTQPAAAAVMPDPHPDRVIGTSSFATGSSEDSIVDLPGYIGSPLDFTHVLYNVEDPVSLVCAVLSLTPQVLVIAYMTLIFSRREAETIMMFGGQVVCELFNAYLKSVLKQERPRIGERQIADGHGMPSAHSQFMMYYATYIVLWMMFRVRHFSWRKKWSRGIGLYILAGLVCYSRVYLYYHSPIQVVVGAVAGAVVGCLWFCTIVLLRDLGIIDLLLDTYPARWFYIKDTAGERSSFVRDEYSEWRRMRMKMKLLIKAD